MVMVLTLLAIVWKDVLNSDIFKLNLSILLDIDSDTHNFWMLSSGFLFGGPSREICLLSFVFAVKFGRHMFHEHKQIVNVFIFTIIIQFYMSILNTCNIRVTV